MRLVDTHIHLTDSKYQDDLSAVLSRAKAVGVNRFICLGTDLADSLSVVQLAAQHDSIFGLVGCHPHEADHFLRSDLGEVLDLAVSDEKVIGYGEVGLDYYYEHSGRAKQRQVFEWFLSAALEEKRLIVVHHRGAEDDMLAMLSSARPPRLICHSFTGSLGMLEALLELNAFISINGMITFNKADNIREIARMVPRDRLLIETDGPYLAPIPYRGRRNEPAFLLAIFEALAKELKMPEDQLMDILEENTRKIFFPNE